MWKGGERPGALRSGAKGRVVSMSCERMGERFALAGTWIGLVPVKSMTCRWFGNWLWWVRRGGVHALRAEASRRGSCRARSYSSDSFGKWVALLLEVRARFFTELSGREINATNPLDRELAKIVLFSYMIPPSLGYSFLLTKHDDCFPLSSAPRSLVVCSLTPEAARLRGGA